MLIPLVGLENGIVEIGNLLQRRSEKKGGEVSVNSRPVSSYAEANAVIEEVLFPSNAYACVSKVRNEPVWSRRMLIGIAIVSLALFIIVSLLAVFTQAFANGVIFI